MKENKIDLLIKNGVISEDDLSLFLKVLVILTKFKVLPTKKRKIKKMKKKFKHLNQNNFV